MLAKAVAHESGANFFSQSASSFVEMFAGLGAARIRRLFKEARDNAPSILFIDELDAVGATRGSDVSGERDQTLNQLLVEMDGFEATENIVVMAASNLLEKLDPALLRPGRFDRQVFVPPPDLRGREEILEVHTRDKPLSQDIDLHRVAQHTSGLTGADLANLCNEAAIQAGRAQARVRRPGRLRQRLRAGRRRPAEPQGDHRPREAGRRLARGRPRARLRAAADGRQGPEGLDRAARQGARLHAQPAAGGPLPEVAPGADRLHEGPARRPRRRADHLRPGHDRRLRRPRQGDDDRPLDGLRVRDGDVDPLPPGPRQRLERLRDDAPAPRRGGHRDRRGGLPRRPAADHRPPRPARRDRQQAARRRGDRAGGDRRDHGRAPRLRVPAGPVPDPGENVLPAPAGNGSPAGLANAADEEPEQPEGGSATPPPGRARSFRATRGGQ